mmetsp:Transcript_94019/g.167255  ORF Transcript_94019/g.167255 Transcript_94019/m.167255 type:complete len:205 (-) Transcript_94019:22-636(-)
MWSPAARLREEGGGAVGLEGRAVATAGGARNAVGQRELDLRVKEGLDTEGGASLDGLLTGGTLEGADAGLDDLGVTDLDGGLAGAVAAGHVHVQTLHGGAHGHIAELLVHVVSAAARVVTDLDAVVVHNAAVLLTDLVDSEDLTSGALHLVNLVQEVPEARLGHNLVLGKQPHAVDLRNGVCLRRLTTTNNLILVERHDDSHYY